MDFGVVGLDGLVGSHTGNCNNTTSTATTSVVSNGFASDSASDPKNKWYGSGFLKQERPNGAVNEDEFRESKVPRISCSEAILLQHKNPLLITNSSSSNPSEGQQMLCFSSPNSQTVSLPYNYHLTSTAFNRNTGYGSGGLNAANMHGLLTGVRGLFTPTQWMELEHQALIYKYITANVPVPSYLLNPIRKALDSAGFSSFGGLRPNTFGWGAFHLGYSNTDPEPGRCRRTDGKKWRCSRDAVPDQKYCERHMNRGRHRSRKPVEGQSGHSVSGTTTTTTTGKPTPVASSTSASVGPGGGASNSLSLSHQLNNLQSKSPLSGTTQLNRSFLGKGNADQGYQNLIGLSMVSPTMNVNNNQYALSKHQNNPFEESTRSEFGLVSSDSLLNPLDKTSLLLSRNYASSDNLKDHDSKSHHPLHQFIQDWPKNESGRSAISLPELDLQSERTQLSISIPMVASDFMSSTSSPSNENRAASPLRLSREMGHPHMGLGVGPMINEHKQRLGNWIPISWEPSIGGPLGEVLHTTNNSTSAGRSGTRALNLMKEGWDSPRLASSPTGVLQRGPFRSLSNSSAGSSPRAESSKTLDGSSLCNGLIGSSLMNPSLPAL